MRKQQATTKGVPAPPGSREWKILLPFELRRIAVELQCLDRVHSEDEDDEEEEYEANILRNILDKIADHMIPQTLAYTAKCPQDDVVQEIRTLLFYLQHELRSVSYQAMLDFNLLGDFATVEEMRKQLVTVDANCREKLKMFAAKIQSEFGISPLTAQSDRSDLHNTEFDRSDSHNTTAGWTKETANAKAMELAKKDSSFAENPSPTQWSKAIGCSKGLVAKLPFYQHCRDKYGTPGKPKVVSLTEDAVAEVESHEILKELIQEQDADMKTDPSPLDETPRKRFGQRKTL
jgi:hypothetical protein